LPSRGFLVTVAKENRELRILRKARIADRKMAKNKNGTTRGFDAPGMETVKAKTRTVEPQHFFG
jgi:hypothetical protein